MTDTIGYDPEELGLKPGRWQNQEKGIMHVFCPFHGSASGKTAIFNYVSGEFLCYSCHAKSTAAKIAKRFGGRLVKKKIKATYDHQEVSDWKNIFSCPVDPTNEYLLKRHVTPEQIEKFQIRTTKKGVAFPMVKHNNTVGFLIRQESDNIRYVYGGEKLCLWPMQNLAVYDTSKPLYVVEGVFGALRGMLYGHQVVATLGTMLKKEVARYLRMFDDVVGVFDNDDAGYVAGYRLLTFLPQAKIVAPGIEVDEIFEAGWSKFEGRKKIIYRSDLSVFASDVDFFNRFKPKGKR